MVNEYPDIVIAQLSKARKYNIEKTQLIADAFSHEQKLAKKLTYNKKDLTTFAGKSFVSSVITH